MANITKAQFINDLNAFLQASANNKKNANTTDVARSNNEISLTNYPPVNISELSTTTVSGPQLQAVLENFTKQFSRVRLVNFYLNINGVNTYQYSRFAKINNTNPDSTRTLPDPAVFNPIKPLEEINLTAYQNILTALENTQNVNYNTLYTDYFFCHSSCHSNCHGSRGRR